MTNRNARRCTASLLAAACLWAGASPARARTVILVRHAEKAAEPAGDPALTPEGRARAGMLAAALRDARPTRVLTSPFRRTRDTAAPTAAAAGVRPQAVPVGRDPATHVAATVALIREIPEDAVVLVVGHGDTVPLIAAALGAPAPVAIPPCAFDRMVIMTLGRSPPATVAARYGPPSADCPD